MKYYFIHMAFAVGLTVPNSIRPIFANSFVCMSYLGNGISNVGLVILNYLGFVGAAQEINQLWQIADYWRLIVSPFRLIKRPSNVWRNKSIVACDVWQVAPSCWNQISFTSIPRRAGMKKKISYYGAIGVSMDCKGVSSSFSKK